MKIYFTCLILTGILFLSACANEEQEEIHAVALKEVENIHIDHGSTTLKVESADIESVEVGLLYNNNGSGIVINEGKQYIKIRLKGDIRRLLNIGKMPELLIRIPASYTGNITIDGSSGNVNIKNLNEQKLDIKGSSGNVALEYAHINNDIHVSVKSGNVLLKLNDKNSNAYWLLKSGSGRRSVAIPLENIQRSNRKTEGQTGDGSVKVQIHTTSGNITIK
ncbi:DUF4097 family beta strand repeat-containing protein [Paenibacillus sp. GXUN7292]|uniref:DUF4097 family beta strand repeat-containing protein n=1 Tax=Paenibacillus sp. GXUN7292 TaxID=3422499 RepID=UPI003D7EF262